MNTKKITFSAVIIAFGIILPFIFHFAFAPTLQLGSKLLPIHYSAFFAGGFFGPLVGLSVGLLTPILSSFTGMPPFPMVIFITFETAVYGIVFGYLYFKKRNNIYLSLVIAMMMGRIAYLLSVYFIGHFILGKGFVIISTLESFTVGMIGIIVQLIIIPIVIDRINSVYGFSNN